MNNVLLRFFLSKPDPDTLNEYIRRTDFLQKLVESQKIVSIFII